MDRSMERIMNKLPEYLKERINNLPDTVIEQLEEIRLKSRENTLLISGGTEVSLEDAGKMTPELLEEILNRLLDYSYYAYENELSKGYITIEGGHRVGICGRVTLKDGEVHLIKDISSLNIRRSRQILGASDKVITSVLDEQKRQVCNTLIVSPPKCGKTTILRDLARNLSSRGFRIGICDERSEIAGCHNGDVSYDLGTRTDILDCCPKAQGMLMLIRAMSPDVIITDEIGKAEDVKAIEEALSAGVKIITTIHGNSFEDIANSSIGNVLKDQIFDTLIFLSSEPTTGTVKKIMKLGGMKKGA